MKATFDVRNKVNPDGEVVEVEYVRIELPHGDVSHRAATEQDRHRFKREYAAFKALLEADPEEPAAEGQAPAATPEAPKRKAKKQKKKEE